MERETGFEPATSTLARLHSTTELLPHRQSGEKWRRHPDLNRRMAVLQTAALPLGYAALKVERETGFEPATSTLARLHSTAELFPPKKGISSQGVAVCQGRPECVSGHFYSQHIFHVKTAGLTRFDRLETPSLTGTYIFRYTVGATCCRPRSMPARLSE
jgi:hypothetical protein